MLTNQDRPTWTVRPRRWPAALIVLILLVGAGAIAVVTWQRQHDDHIAVPPVEAGSWRTEQYRDITFEAPVDWAYDFEPGTDWCVDQQRPEPRPYVALGQRGIVLGIDCGDPMPDDLIVEHVAALQPADKKADGRVRLGGGFWEITRTVGAVKLRAVSKNPALAQRIVDSGAPTGGDDLCAPTNPMQTDPDARPEPSDVTGYCRVERLILCQYESAGLRAATSVSGTEAQQLIDAIADRPLAPDDADCGGHDRHGLDLSIVIRAELDDRREEIFLRVNGCADGSFYFGGFDDGTNVRTLDRATCRSVVRLPLLMQSGGETAYKLCTRTR